MAFAGKQPQGNSHPRPPQPAIVSDDAGENTAEPALRSGAKQFALATKFSSGLLVLSRNPLLENIPPVVLLKAAWELLFLNMGVSWMLTLAFAEGDYVANNYVRDRLGYNSLPVCWHVPPAKHVGGVLWMGSSYYALRFVFMNQLRSMRDPDSIKFSGLANLFYRVTIFSFILTFVVDPKDSIWMHTLPFLALIVTNYMLVLALCLENWEHVTGPGKIFLVCFGIVSLLLPSIVVSEFLYYDAHGEKSSWPSRWTLYLDCAWLLGVVVSVCLIPSVNVVVRTMEVVPKREMMSFVVR